MRRSGLRRFAFRLALALGFVNINVMLRQITLTDLKEWMAYAELEPFGELRDDYRMANQMQLLANVNRNAEKRPEPYQLSDFLFNFDGEEQPVTRQTWQEQKQIAMMYAAMYNKPEGVA